METGRTAALVALGVVLFVTLASANAVIALDRTAFDAGYAQDTAEETELYAALGEEIRAQITANASAGTGDSPLNRSRSELLAAALTDEYVRTQGERNIGNVYDYLNGRTGELRIGFRTEPLEERLLEEVEADVEELDLATTGMPFGAEIEAMAGSEAEFDARREAFREEQKRRIQRETERELSNEELEAALEDSMDDIRGRMVTEMDSQLEGEFEGSQAPLEEPVRELQLARIDALTGRLTYEEYATAVESGKDDFRDAFVGVVESDLRGELPETVDATDQLGPEGTEALETARSVVSVSGALAVGLSVLAFLFVGGIGWLAPKALAAIEVGAVATLAGALGAGGAIAASGRLRNALAGSGAPPGIEEFLIALAAGVFDALTLQSGVLAVVGVSLLAVGIALRRGVIGGGEEDGPTGEATDPQTDGAETTERPGTQDGNGNGSGTGDAAADDTGAERRE